MHGEGKLVRFSLCEGAILRNRRLLVKSDLGVDEKKSGNSQSHVSLMGTMDSVSVLGFTF